MIILLLFLSFINVYSYKICIVGADSTLGRELVYQSLKEKKYNTLALTGKNYLTGKNKIIYEKFGIHIICAINENIIIRINH